MYSMFFQLLFIHLFRPFLKYKPTSSPLPAHVSPRRFCTHAAATISKLLRLYKRTHGLRQIVNLAVYITHTACTIHLLNLPEKNAVRDLVHGLKHLEEIAEGWLCARKTLRILSIVARKWSIDLPEEAEKLLQRTDAKFAMFSLMDQVQPKPEPLIHNMQVPASSTIPHSVNAANNPPFGVQTNGFFNATAINTPTPTPDISRPHGSLSLPPQSAAEIANQSRQQQYVLPQAQQEMWSRDRANRASASAPASGTAPQQAKNAQTTSPSMLFGGVDQLMEDSQDYWLHDDMGTLFENWNGVEGDVMGGG